MLPPPMPPVPREACSSFNDDADYDDWADRLTRIHDTPLHWQVIEFDYEDNAGIRSHRMAKILSLAYLGHRYYLECWCFARNDIRHFKLDSVVGPVFLIGTQTEFASADAWLHHYNVRPGKQTGLLRLDRSQQYQDRIQKIVERIAPRITVLLYLARFDGVINSTEQQLIEAEIDASLVQGEHEFRRWVHDVLLSEFADEKAADDALIKALQNSEEDVNRLTDAVRAIGSAAVATSRTKQELIALLEKLILQGIPEPQFPPEADRL